jgi:hypothetical protein
MITPEDFEKLTPRDQAAVLIHESGQLAIMASDAWYAGENCELWSEDIKKHAEAIHALIRRHYESTYGRPK